MVQMMYTHTREGRVVHIAIDSFRVWFLDYRQAFF